MKGGLNPLSKELRRSTNYAKRQTEFLNKLKAKGFAQARIIEQAPSNFNRLEDRELLIVK